MPMQDFKCPHCGKTIELTDAIKHQVDGELAKSIEQKVRSEIQEKASEEVAELKRQLEDKDKKVADMREAEIKLREERRKLEEDQKDLKLNLERQLDSQKAKIEEDILKKAAEEHKFLDLEKDKRIGDLQKQLEEALRRTRVSSQQLQGEVLELDLEATLKEAFPNDDIGPVGKGVRGADIYQIVKSPKGVSCGTILWEAKRTKSWEGAWTGKLKEDLRSNQGNMAVIVSLTLPDEARDGFGLKDGVWVVSYPLVLPIAMLLRKNLLDVTFQKVVGQHKGEKAEVLYEYVTSHEFRQQLEALVDVYTEMQGQITKERAAFEKIWKARESQIKRLVTSTSSVVGSIQGRVGQSALPVKGLELQELTSGE